MPAEQLQRTHEAVNFRIEDARPEDVEQMMSILKDSLLKEVYPSGTLEIPKEDMDVLLSHSRDAIDRRRNEIIEKSDSVHIWVARDDNGKILGFCKASKNQVNRSMKIERKIDDVYVAKEFMEKGIGGKLMEKAIEWLGTKEDVVLFVGYRNSRTIEFYEKFGFSLKKKTEDSFDGNVRTLPSGTMVPFVKMVRPGQN